MNFIQRLLAEARQKKRRIVLPEWDDVRIQQACCRMIEQHIAQPVLIGDAQQIRQSLEQNNYYNDAIEIVDIRKFHDHFLTKVQQKYSKKEPINPSQAQEILQSSIVQAALLLEGGHVDGMVAGANHSTAEVVSTSLKVIGLAADIQTASSFFIMVMPNDLSVSDSSTRIRPPKIMIFADCALVIDPNKDQLADICLATLDSAKHFLDEPPKVAMLSFSTEGSAVHRSQQKVALATEIIRQRQPDLNIMGEVQFDAAMVAEVAELKLKQQAFIGPANVLIFPHLNAANIAYKLTQRLVGADAIGPILQGFAQPVNDLSRGTSVDEIVHTVAVTCLQC